MEFEESSLFREVQAVTAGGVKPVHATWGAQFHVNGQTYNALKVLSIDTVADYEGNYSDVIIAELVVMPGTFWKRVYPYMDAVEVTLIKTPLQETGDSVDQNRALQSERYKAILHTTGGSPFLENTGMNEASEEALNITDLLTVTVELMSQALYQVNMITSGVTLRNCTVERALKAVLTKESQRVQVDNQRLIKGVNMVPANNDKQRDHVHIPQGMPLAHIPAWIHEQCGGVYSAGFGYYLQNGYWYVYPMFDPARQNPQGTMLTIVNVPKNKMPSVERTYRQDGDNLTILSTGEVRFKDDSNIRQLNEGNGARWADADKIMTGFAIVEKNIATVSRGANNTEVVTKQRPDGLNNAPVSANAITANPFVEYSKLAKREGSVMGLMWQNSDPRLIAPGMIATILYLDDTQVKTVQGVILKAHHNTALQGEGLTQGRHMTNSSLSVFVKRPVGNGET